MNRAGSQLKSWAHRSSHQFVLTGWQSEKSDRTLVHFMPGNGLCSRVYDPFLSQFTDNFDFFMHDMQGHGRSETGKQFIGWEASAAEAMAILEKESSLIGGRPLIGMGHSFGAIITLLMAVKNPGLFSRIILLDPVLFPHSYIAVIKLARVMGLRNYLPMPYHTRKRRDTWASEDAAWDYLRDRGIFKTWHEESFSQYIGEALRKYPDGNFRLRCPPWLEADIFASVPKALWKSVRSLGIPAKIYHGSESYHWIGPSVQKACRVNDLISHRVIEGCGHCFMLEKPDKIHSVVQSGLTELSRLH